jgi:hypothetical protein
MINPKKWRISSSKLLNTTPISSTSDCIIITEQYEVNSVEKFLEATYLLEDVEAKKYYWVETPRRNRNEEKTGNQLYVARSFLIVYEYVFVTVLPDVEVVAGREMLRHFAKKNKISNKVKDHEWKQSKGSAECCAHGMGWRKKLRGSISAPSPNQTTLI